MNLVNSYTSSSGRDSASSMHDMKYLPPQHNGHHHAAAAAAAAHAHVPAAAFAAAAHNPWLTHHGAEAAAAAHWAMHPANLYPAAAAAAGVVTPPDLKPDVKPHSPADFQVRRTYYYF